MKTSSLLAVLILVLTLGIVAPLRAQDQDNEARPGKKQLDRAMLEKMEAVPCGAKQKGITGLGYAFASAGLEHVTSDEKLCPEYLLRTDTMEYEVRPTDKHPVVLPVGHEGEFRIKGGALFLRMAEGQGDRKMRAYQVVSEKPLDNTAGSLGPTENKASDDKSVER